MIFSFVWLCVFYNGVVPVVPCLALCSRVFSVLLSIMFT